MRDVGAILMGKATLSEWADMRSNNYSKGYSGRGGQARSSYNFAVNPGGSSSGSAIAAANNVVPFSLGTETDGSVINPAERNAIFRFKPTVGLTSRDGVIPESAHQDLVGTFGKTVRDAVYALDAIYGVDERDNYTFAQDGKTPTGGYCTYLSDASALKGARFRIPRASFWHLADQEQLDVLLDMVRVIEEAGAFTVNGTELPHYRQIVSPDGWNWDSGSTRGYPNESEYTYVKADSYNNIAAFLSGLSNTKIRSLEDLVQYSIDNAKMAFFQSLETKGVMNHTDYEALSFCQRTNREKSIDAALTNGGNPVDLLLVPPDVGQSYQIASQAGYPVIIIPASVHSLSGMPFGLALIGTAFSEALLVKYASAIANLMVSSGSQYQRSKTPPTWDGYLTREIPVAWQCAEW